jgi:hypothetical protein
MKRAQILVIAAAVTLSVPSAAHHAFTAIYHVDQELVIEGVVTDYRFINPHARIYLDVVNDDGGVENWMAEGGTPNVLVRQGWDGEELVPGDRVTIAGNPAKSGKRIIHWLNITMPNGDVLFGEDIDFGSIDRRR